MTTAECLDIRNLVDAIRNRGPVRRHQLRNFIVGGVRTSVRLDPIFWLGFDRICRDEAMRPDALVDRIHTVCPGIGLTNAVRTFTMTFTMLHGPGSSAGLGPVGRHDTVADPDVLAAEIATPDADTEEAETLPVAFTPEQEEVLRVEMTSRPRLAQALMVLIAQYPPADASNRSGPDAAG